MDRADTWREFVPARGRGDYTPQGLCIAALHSARAGVREDAGDLLLAAPHLCTAPLTPIYSLEFFYPRQD